MIFVDGVDIGDVTDVALRDRRMLSADGIFVVVATISEQDGSWVAEPEVIFRGVPFVDEADKLLERDLRDTVDRIAGARGAKEEIREIDLLQQILHDDLAAFVYEQAQAPRRWCCRSSSRSDHRRPAQGRGRVARASAAGRTSD